MHGAREAWAGGISHIEEHIKGIEQAVTDNTGFAFDLAKSLIESTCKTILSERGPGFDKNDDLPKLFRSAIKQIPLLPPSSPNDSKTEKPITQTINGLHTALLGICELRNVYGFASHGTDGKNTPLETVQALLAAQTADTIVGFLFRCHRQGQEKSILNYGDNEEFNEYFDDVHGKVEIIGSTFKASEILFLMDQVSYIQALREYELEEMEDDSDELILAGNELEDDEISLEKADEELSQLEQSYILQVESLSRDGHEKQ